MANPDQSAQNTPAFGGFSHSGAQQCSQCELMLADVLDGALSAEEQTAFDLHVATCTPCYQMLGDAQRGAAWLEMLRTPHPEPPAALLERILVQTSGTQTSGAQALRGQAFGGQAQESRSAVFEGLAVAGMHEAQADAIPTRLGTVLPFRSRVSNAFRRNPLAHTLLQPRLAMTAAMAFFSIGLTLNLTGVRLNQLRLADLKPAAMRRSFYQADAHLLRYYTNLRVVYELESRVRDLQRVNDSEPASSGDGERKPADEPKAKPTRPPGAGTSRHQSRRDTWNAAAVRSVGFPRTSSSFTRFARKGVRV